MPRLKPNEYFRPGSVAEAISILAEHGEKARIIAGGTDLLVEKPSRVECLVDISNLGLNYIKKENGICIGAATTIREIEASPLLKENPYDVLYETTSKLGSGGMRNTGTIGGNLCNASPAADLPPSLMVLDAKINVAGPESERIIEIEDFFKGVKKNALRSNEVLVEVQIPPFRSSSWAVFHKLTRYQREEDIALVNAAIRVDLEEEGVCKEARVSLGAVAPVPIRARKSEALLRGSKLSMDVIEKSAWIASDETSPISDVRASADYRREMIKVLVERALKEAMKKAEKAAHES